MLQSALCCFALHLHVTSTRSVVAGVFTQLASSLRLSHPNSFSIELVWCLLVLSLFSRRTEKVGRIALDGSRGQWELRKCELKVKALGWTGYLSLAQGLIMANGTLKCIVMSHQHGQN